MANIRYVLRGVRWLTPIALAAVFVGTCWLWARSYRVADQLHREKLTWLEPDGAGIDGITLTLTSSWGRLHVRRLRLIDRAFAGERLRTLRTHVRPTEVDWSVGQREWPPVGYAIAEGLTVVRDPPWHGFVYRRNSFKDVLKAKRPERTKDDRPIYRDVGWRSGTEHFLSIPLWLPALLSAFAPVMATTRRLRRRARRSRGHCPECGYDLRAHTAEGARCPECGHPAAPQLTSTDAHA